MFRKLAGLTAIAGLFVGGIAAADTMVGSAHDFSGETWTNEICVVCHTPHNSIGTDGPLWNRANYDASVPAFVMYPSGGTIQGTIDPDPTGTSAICLSCHEGSLNVDSFGGGAGTVAVGDINPLAVVGVNLSNEHPISITYNTADLELNATADTVTFGNGGSGTVADLLDTGNKVQCSSCHDVHNTQTAVGGPSLLRVANDSANGSASGLCLSCHGK